jgi:hypothetical protein
VLIRFSNRSVSIRLRSVTKSTVYSGLSPQNASIRTEA